MRHLPDGRIDKHFTSTNNSLTGLLYHLKRLISDLFIVDKSIKPEDENEGENISSVYLNKHILKRKVEEILLYDANFQKELLSVY
ncbi:16024_t:CDS:2 [Funneliformis geosporum]|uniref:16024_t:CDS:1 n=1 Tax=Funneliformis geosporum TaxID=1117311 RepID=A0A9W4SIL8_9GLOM|nr:16024_t:CDS:2 [Funneliformis geosporum]